MPQFLSSVGRGDRKLWTLEGVALGPRDVHHGGGAVVALKAGDQFLIVPALVLGVVGEPAFLHQAAAGDSFLRLGLKPVYDALDDLGERAALLAHPVLIGHVAVGHGVGHSITSMPRTFPSASLSTLQIHAFLV